MITPGELWFGRTAGTQVRLSSRRICRGGALSPPAVHGLMDVLYGPTDMSARTRSVAEGTTGGHTGPPLRDHRSAQPPQRGGTEPAPYRCAAGSAQQRADVPRAWLPPAKFRNGIWGVSHRHRPLRGEGEVSATARASGAQRSVYASGRKGWAGIGAGITPKGAINLGQSLSHGCAVPAPFAQGSLRDGGCGLPRRPCGPPRNDNRFLSFRGAERRGNPFSLGRVPRPPR